MPWGLIVIFFLLFIFFIALPLRTNIKEKEREISEIQRNVEKKIEEDKQRQLSLSHNSRQTGSGYKIITYGDSEKQSVINGHAKAAYNYLSSLETQLSSGTCPDPQAAYNKWHKYYQKYRNFCMANKLPNCYIGDCVTQAPTPFQLEQEEQLYVRIQSHYEREIKSWEENRKYQTLFLDFLSSKPYKQFYRHHLLNALANGDPSEKMNLQKHYKRLIAADVLRERQDETRHYVVYLPPKVKPKPASKRPLRSAPYDASRYQAITTRTEYKVFYTVDAPIEANPEAKTCAFVSTSTGDQYYTSLGKCTCPQGNQLAPCKHMLALSLYFHYYVPQTPEGKAWQSHNQYTGA